MITQIREYGDFTGTNTYFIIGKSWEEVDTELKNFIKEHGTNSNEIWIYKEPVRPSKINLRPEYTMEVNVMSEKDSGILMIAQTCVWDGGSSG